MLLVLDNRNTTLMIKCSICVWKPSVCVKQLWYQSKSRAQVNSSERKQWCSSELVMDTYYKAAQNILSTVTLAISVRVCLSVRHSVMDLHQAIWAPEAGQTLRRSARISGYIIMTCASLCQNLIGDCNRQTARPQMTLTQGTSKGSHVRLFTKEKCTNYCFKWPFRLSKPQRKPLFDEDCFRLEITAEIQYRFRIQIMIYLGVKSICLNKKKKNISQIMKQITKG